ncbi:MAG: ABC transporter permease, partial [Gammaproteobacteria bacterium]
MSQLDLAPASAPHFVSSEPFDPYSVERLSPEQERYFLASQWRMMWWRFKRHRLAVVSCAILAVFYLSTLATEFLSPYELHSRHTGYLYAPPQPLHFFHEGEFIGPFVYGISFELNMDLLQREYSANPNEVQRLRFFCRGDRYRYFGLWQGDLHLMCPAEGGT